MVVFAELARTSCIINKPIYYPCGTRKGNVPPEMGKVITLVDWVVFIIQGGKCGTNAGTVRGIKGRGVYGWNSPSPVEFIVMRLSLKLNKMCASGTIYSCWLYLV